MLNGFTTKNLADLFDVTIPGTQKIALDATVIYAGFNLIYLLIDEQIYKVPTMMYGGYNQGDDVIIIGQRSIIDGVADYTYDVRLLNTQTTTDFLLTPIVTTISQLYANDYTLNPIHRQAHTIFGYLEYDAHMNYYTLTDEEQMVYVRLLSSYWGQGDMLEAYLGEFVSLNVILSRETFRAEYYVVDLYDQDTGIDLKDYTIEEELTLISNRLAELSGLDIYSGERLVDFLPSNYSVHPNIGIFYSLVNPSGASFYDENTSIFSGSETTTQVLFNVTIIHAVGLDHTEKTLTIAVNIQPQIDSTIFDVLYGEDEKTYQTNGVIVAIGQNQDYVIIDDGANRIMVDLKNIGDSTFKGAEVVLALGDEIRVISKRDHFDGTKTIPMLGTPQVIEVISTDNTVANIPVALTVSEVHALPNNIIKNNYQYIELTGKFCAFYPAGVENYNIVIGVEGEYTPYLEHIRVYIESDDESLDLTSLHDLEVVITGYLVGYDSLGRTSSGESGYVNWVMVYESHVIAPE